MSNEGSIQVRVGQKGGITQAILNKLKQEGTVKGNLSASIWGQIMDTIKEDAVEQDKKQWKKGSEFENPTKDKKHWQKNFVVTKGQVLEFSKDLWNKIVSLATTGKLPEKKVAETPKVETPKAETPKVETPEAETPEAGTPEAGTPKAGTQAPATEEKPVVVNNYATQLPDQVMEAVKELKNKESQEADDTKKAENSSNNIIKAKNEYGEDITVKLVEAGDVTQTEIHYSGNDKKGQLVETKAKEASIVTTRVQIAMGKPQELTATYNMEGEVQSVEYLDNADRDMTGVEREAIEFNNGIPTKVETDYTEVPRKVMKKNYTATDLHQQKMKAGVSKTTYFDKDGNVLVKIENGVVMYNDDGEFVSKDKKGSTSSIENKAVNEIRKHATEMLEELDPNVKTTTKEGVLKNGERVNLTEVINSNGKLVTKEKIDPVTDNVVKIFYDRNGEPLYEEINFEGTDIDNNIFSRKKEGKFIDQGVEILESSNLDHITFMKDKKSGQVIFTIQKVDQDQEGKKVYTSDNGTKYVIKEADGDIIKKSTAKNKLNVDNNNIGYAEGYYKQAEE